MPRVIRALDQLSIAFCWALIVNCAHMGVVVYELPTELSTLLVPAIAGVYIGLRLGLKRGLISTICFSLITAILLFLTMDLPSRIGIMDPRYAPIFDLIIALKVARSTILISLVSIISELITSMCLGLRI